MKRKRSWALELFCVFMVMLGAVLNVRAFVPSPPAPPPAPFALSLSWWDLGCFFTPWAPWCPGPRPPDPVEPEDIEPIEPQGPCPTDEDCL